MRAKLRFLVLAAFLWPFAAHAGDKTDLMRWSDSHNLYTWPVSWAQLEASPSWSPSSDAPPLSIAKAVALATGWIKKKNPRFDEFRPTRIALQHTSYSTDDGHSFQRWYYTIEFNPVVNGEGLYGGIYVAVVLFDGTVIEPRVEKRTQ